MASLKRSLSETDLKTNKKTKLNKAVQCTETENVNKSGFNIWVNRDIYMQYDSKTQKIRFESKAEDGKVKKNVALQSWSIFCDNLAEIEKAVIQVENGEANIMYKLHLGNLMFVTVQSNYRSVDLRPWYIPRQAEENPSIDTLRPGLSGLSLRTAEFRNVMHNLTAIQENLGFDLLEPCYLTHQNQEAAVECSVCNPRRMFY